MDKATIKLFIAWLDEATEQQLVEKRQEIVRARQHVATPEGKADIKLALRLVDEEVLARLELSKILALPQRAQG
jgi:hypothetical protein